jgi:hypothetical protein
MPNTQKEVKPRPDRGRTVNHVVVPAHGATETQDHDYSEDASGAKPCQGETEGKGENDERIVKASKVAERHVTSKNGLDVAKERQKHVAGKREESAKLFDSKRLSVIPERKGVKHLKK